MTDTSQVEDLDQLGFVLALDGKGGGRPAVPQEVSGERGDAGIAFVWIHAQIEEEQNAARIRRLPGLDSTVLSALLASETRPRCTFHDGGAILNLRGVNLNPGADPEDMVSLRLWVQAERVVSVCRRRLMGLEDVLRLIEAANGPKDVGELIALLAFRLSERVDPLLLELSDKIDILEESSGEAAAREVQQKVVDLKLKAIKLKHFITPQREALRSLLAGEASWIDKTFKRRLQETVDRVTRFSEVLENLRERASILQEELMFQRTEALNSKLLMLSIVAAIFLPLTFVTGLLGMNVAGIPGADSPLAFAAICGAMLAILTVQIGVLRRLGWL